MAIAFNLCCALIIIALVIGIFATHWVHTASRAKRGKHNDYIFKAKDDTIQSLRRDLELVSKASKDLNEVNNTTVKLNDFYSSKIAKIQAILNEKE